jgi:hypothetical protein
VELEAVAQRSSALLAYRLELLPADHRALLAWHLRLQHCEQVHLALAHLGLMDFRLTQARAAALELRVALSRSPWSTPLWVLAADLVTSPYPLPLEECYPERVHHEALPDSAQVHPEQG